MAFDVPPLKFAEDALEPHISADTVRFHYGKHTKKYFEVANSLAKGTVYEDKTLEQVMTKDSLLRMESVLFNNVCQAWNHAFYWDCLTPPNKSGKPSDKLKSALDEAFGSYDDFVKKFEEKATKHFGSGWAWLVFKDGDLSIKTTPNAGSPLTDKGSIPLLTCDVWEHAYYLDYQNDRAGYVKKFWNVVNWEFVNERFERAA